MKDLSNNNIVHVVKDGIQYIQFKKLLEYKDILTHAYAVGLDKNYRTSKSNATVNEDELKKAKKNYDDLCNELNLNSNNIAKAFQMHTDVVECINKIEDVPTGVGFDGLITDKNNIVLTTCNADCILLLFFDPVKKVIANIHSGWRGTLQRISVKTVNKMINDYGCNPSDIICCMCPSIRQCHFEVDEDVKLLYETEFTDLKCNDFIEEKIKDKKWNIDTIRINKILLSNLGLKDENIIDSGICSVCDGDLIHSYRKEGQKYGLCTAIISIHNPQ